MSEFWRRLRYRVWLHAQGPELKARVEDLERSKLLLQAHNAELTARCRSYMETCADLRQQIARQGVCQKGGCK